MKAGFISRKDRIVLAALTDEEREAIIQRERQRVVSSVYTELRNKLEPLGLTLNGSCTIHDDGRLRFLHPEPTSDDATTAETDVARLVSRLRYYASGYSYASLGRLIGTSGTTVRAWVDGRYGPSPSSVRAVAKLVRDLEAKNPEVMGQLTPVGVNRGWNES